MTGFAINTTLYPSVPNYEWIDKGEILRSSLVAPGFVEFLCGDQGKFFNAIDAALFIDNDGKLWMAFGSSIGSPAINKDLASPVHLGGVFGDNADVITAFLSSSTCLPYLSSSNTSLGKMRVWQNGFVVSR